MSAEEPDYGAWSAQELVVALHGMAAALPSAAALLKECSARIIVGDAEAALQGRPDPDRVYLDLLRDGKRIRAIKTYRADNGVGLKDAKDAIDLLANRHQIL